MLLLFIFSIDIKIKELDAKHKMFLKYFGIFMFDLLKIYFIQPPTPLSTPSRKTISIPAIKLPQTTFPLPKISRFVPQN